MDDAQLALAALRSLAGECPEGGVQALLAVFERHGLEAAVEVLARWDEV